MSTIWPRELVPTAACRDANMPSSSERSSNPPGSLTNGDKSLQSGFGANQANPLVLWLAAD